MSKTKRSDRQQSPAQGRRPAKGAKAKAPVAKATLPKAEPPAPPAVEELGADGLTNKQRAFVEHYLMTWNAAESARRAGYSHDSAYSIGWENLRKPEIATLIAARMGQMTMESGEVLLRLALQARADLGDFVDASGNIDLAAAKQGGRMHLVKKISNTESGLTIELHNSQKALELIGRALKLFVDVQEHTGSVTLNHDMDAAIAKAYGEDNAGSNS